MESASLENDQLLVGWQQIELDGTPCMTASSQVAVQFDTSLLDRIPDKVITHVVLTYDEQQATGCNQGLPGGTAGRLAAASPRTSRTAVSSFGFPRPTGPPSRRTASFPTSHIRVDAPPWNASTCPTGT
jgi:hypothetical protein